MIRRKTTIYLDSDVLAATKVLAATRDRSESQVVEEALRLYLRSTASETARDDLRALMERMAGRADLTEEEAMTLAVQETRSARTARRSRQSA